MAQREDRHGAAQAHDRRRNAMPLGIAAAVFAASFALMLCPSPLRWRILAALAVATCATLACSLAWRRLASGRLAPESHRPSPAQQPEPPANATANTAHPDEQEASTELAPLAPPEAPAPSPDEASTTAPADIPASATASAEDDGEPEGSDEPEKNPLALLGGILGLLETIQAASQGDQADASSFDPVALVAALTYSDDVIGSLKAFVGSVRTREAEGDETLVPAARVLARWLVEAGLFGQEVMLPPVSCVSPEHTRLAYLRINATRLPYLAKVRVLAIESALNRMLLVARSIPDLAAATEEEVLRRDAELEASIATQLSNEQLDGTREWDVRHTISLALESWALPQRLTAEFRTNVAGGTAAAVVELPHPLCFSRTRWSEPLGRAVPATREARMRAVSEYSARTCLMVAAQMLLSSQGIERVFVAGVTDNGARHLCHLSFELTRDKLPLVLRDDRPEVPNPIWVLSVLGARMDPWGGVLRPVRQGFSLDDERFCPQVRYEEVGLSTRRLAEGDARALGARHVNELEIDEEAHREHAATAIVRGLSGSVEHDVRLILDSSRNDPDPSVRVAALRTVGKLIDGSLEGENALAVRDEFVDGDELTDALREAVEGFRRGDPKAVAGTLAQALGMADAMGSFEDDGTQEFRCFRSYVERTLYNRLIAAPGRAVRLAPGAYHAGQIMLSDALAMLGDEDGSLEHARRAVELDPLDERGHLRVSRALEAKGDLMGAAAQVGELLRVAWKPDVIAVCYWRLSQIAFHAGDFLAADACTRFCLRFTNGGPLEQAAVMATMMWDAAGSTLGLADEGQVEDALRSRDIPLAPTQEVLQALNECARAAVDAEVFPVARDLARALGRLTSDDVIWGIARSIEREPDR